MNAIGRVKRWETLMLALLIAIVALNSLASPYFLNVGNLVNLFQLSIEKSIVALTMALVIIGGEIDLSVASVMGLAACVMAWTFHEGAPLPIAIALALLAGVAGRAQQCLLDSQGRPAVACGHAGWPDRLSRRRPHPVGRPRDRRLSGSGSTRSASRR